MNKRLLLWGVYICALVIFFEAVLAIYFTVSTGQVIYTRDAKAGALREALQLPGAVFQPYMGYTLRRGRTGSYLDEGEWIANNFGFQIMQRDDAAGACCDIPYKPGENEYIVGVFGGSVGAGFALQAQADGLFAKTLQSVDGIADRKVIILNFGQSGFKQPQQLTALAYFLSIGQHFDLILNIDGFNEVVTSWKNWSNGVEPSFPADLLWGAWGRQIEQRKIPVAEQGFHLANFHDLAGQAARAREDTCGFAVCYYWAKSKGIFHSWRARENRRTLPEDTELNSIFPTKSASPFPQNLDIFKVTAEVWRQSSLGMAKLSTLAGARYIHVLQPNQWFRPSGAYTPIAGDHIYKWVIKPVNHGYRELRARIPDLETAGIRFLDGSLLFKDVPARSVYVDDCCHYTAQGYRLIYRSVAEALSN